MKSNDYSGQEIYIGLDVHLSSWDFQIMTAHSKHRHVHFNHTDETELVRFLHLHYPNGIYKCVYEAGFSGFGTQEKLTELGVETIVVHAADVPTTDKENRNKTDKIDSGKLARGLRSGELVGIHIPSKQRQEDRALVRQRYSYASKERAVKNQIKSHLHFMGIKIEEEESSKHWSNKFILWLEGKAQILEDATLKSYIKRLRGERKFVLTSMRVIRKLSKETRFAENYKLLFKIPGFGFLTIMVFLTEIGDVSRFGDEDKIISYVGLTPTRRSSGTKDYVGRMNKRGNTKIQTAIILAAWNSIRKPNKFSIYYDHCKSHLKKDSNKAIILVAKKLVKTAYAILRDKTEYKE